MNTPRPSFFAELQRRHVYKVGAMYCVAGWLLVQVVTQVFPVYGLSADLQKIIVTAVMAGFPVALVLAWVFDVTPQGIVRTDAVPEGGESSAVQDLRRRKDRRLNVVLAVLLVCALAYVAFDHFIVRPSAGVATIEQNDKSIAVLPFANLSRDPDNAFFADGMQDEILTKLSKIGALHVVSRTSTQRYASAPANVPEIARELGVATILEGSVQKAGELVHINVQLIRAAGDEHLWAESYDRKLDNIFGVEGEVAQAVAEALDARLSGSERQAVAAKPTDNAAAYEAYLRGRAIVSASYSFASAKSSLDDYYEAVRLDPKFALAWAYIAQQASIEYFDGLDTSRATADAIRQAAQTALKLAPQSGEALLAHGYYLYRVEHDYAGALDDLRRAQEKLPNESAVMQGMFLIERRMGRWDEALAHQEEVIRRNPRDVSALAPMGCEGYNYVRRFDQARAVLQRALEVTPDEPDTLGCLAGIEQNLGNLDAADAWLARAPVAIQELAGPQRIQQLLFRRDFAAAIRLIQGSLPGDDAALIGPDIQNLIYLGYALRWTGQTVEARKVLARAVRVLLQSADAMEHTEIIGHQTLGLAYAGLGQRDDAIAAAKAGVGRNTGDGIKQPLAQIAQAQVLAQLGERDAAIALLPPLLAVPAGLNPPLLRNDPMWDPLRDDPRFQKLAEMPAVQTPEGKPQ